MPTSSYMPDVEVHIAFDSGFLTPRTSYTWTDVSPDLELDKKITIKIGKNDEQSKASANTCVLTLDNTSGNYTPERLASIYYPNVKLDRPIRVRYTPVDGSRSVRFIGFITEWPVEWEDTDGRAMVTITASSRLGRMTATDGFRSVVEETILIDRPLAYYTMADPAGSIQAADSSGNRVDPLVSRGPVRPVVFGVATGPGVDGLTAATFDGYSDTEYGMLSGSFNPGTGARGMGCHFSLSSLPINPAYLMVLLNNNYDYPVATDGLKGVYIQIGSPGYITAVIVSFTGTTPTIHATLTTPVNVVDGNIHRVDVAWGSASGAQLFLDGVQVASTVAALPSLTDLNTLSIGRYLTGNVSHAAVFTTQTSTTSAADYWTAGKDGFAGDTTSTRFARYIRWTGLTVNDVSLETGQITVQHVDPTGKQPLDMLQLMETSEGGLLYDSTDGFIYLRNRASRSTQASQYTIDMAVGMGEGDYAPRLDRSTLLNRVSVDDTSGRYTARVDDLTSQTENGVSADSFTTASDDDDEPGFIAAWMIYKYKNPKSRVPNLTIKVLDQVGKTPNSSTIVSNTFPGALISVVNRPSADSSSTATFFVEGWTEVIGPEEIDLTFNLSPGHPDDLTLVIGDATRGVIGTNPVAL